MQSRAAKTAQRKPAGQQGPDPRFAAFARLLARDLARKHFEQEESEKRLKARADEAYDSDSRLKEKT